MTVSSDPPISVKKSYQCIYCATPCDALYRVYGAAAVPTIRLSRCMNCKCDVDPYCERELMLVVLDCLLFREEAYRHFFFHRYRNVDFDTHSSQIMLLLASSGLRAYVVTMAQYGSPEQYISQFVFTYIQQTILSCIVSSIQIGSIAFGLFVAANWTEEYAPLCSSSTIRLMDFLTQISLAILLPTACHGATIFMQIWEDSDIIRIMGSCLVLTYQWYALHTIIRGHLRVGSVSQSVILLLVFVVSLMGRDILLEMVRIIMMDWNFGNEALLNSSSPCAGLEFKMNRIRLPMVISNVLEIPDNLMICLS